MGRPGRPKEPRRKGRRKKAATKVGPVSPYRSAGVRSRTLGWYVNHNWRDSGQAVVFALRRAPEGYLVLAAFFVDIWCLGLKDAWGQLDMVSDEWDDLRRHLEDGGMELLEVDAEVGRRLVAGGIRFARRNGFRLPRRYERWVAVAGGVGDVASAPLDDFGKDGGFCYTGRLSDLRRRLVACPLDEFLQREDVRFVLDADELRIPDMAPAVEKVALDVRNRTLHSVRQWCRVNGIVPHPRLPEAATLIVIAAVRTPYLKGARPGEDIGLNALARMVDAAPPGERDGLDEALRQIAACAETSSLFGSDPAAEPAPWPSRQLLDDATASR